jgi:hypothetical protein
VSPIDHDSDFDFAKVLLSDALDSIFKWSGTLVELFFHAPGPKSPPKVSIKIEICDGVIHFFHSFLQSEMHPIFYCRSNYD